MESYANMLIENLLDQVKIVCPNDHTKLVVGDNGLKCPTCSGFYPILNNRIINLLPLSPSELGSSFSAEYQSGYREEFFRPFLYDKKAIPWGAPEEVPEKWAKIRVMQANLIYKLLETEGHPDTSCDFSGGAGYFSLKYSQKFKIVLHCDLSMSSLSYVYTKAEAMRLDNMFFLRIDYFHPPFFETLPSIICTDTLIRNPVHERMVLEQIYRSLEPTGKAVVDFHNWLHNPIRRIGFMHQNFRNNKSYRRFEIEDENGLLQSAGIESFRYYPFHQEFDVEDHSFVILKHLIPPTRLFYQIFKS
jgi:SAM-dependent methyltransferase